MSDTPADGWSPANPDSARPDGAGPDGAGPDGASRDTAGWDQPPARPNRRGRWVIAAVCVLALILLGGGGAYAFARLSGAGPQPESALPASTIAMVKLDLNPGAGQKLAAYRLFRKFPAAKIGTDQDKAVQSLIRSATRDSGGIDFDADVRPWLGKRAAVAVVPSGNPADPFGYAAVVAYTDQAAMTSGLHHLQQHDGRAAFGFTGHDGYVLIAATQREADRYATAAAAKPLARVGTLSADIAALHGDQIAVAWADFGALWNAIPESDRRAASTAFGGGSQPLAGRYVAGLHLSDSAVEVSGRGFDLKLPEASTRIGVKPTGGNLIGELPADGVAAVSVTGLDEAVSSFWDRATAAVPDTRGLAQSLGIRLPDDLKTLLGQQTALWLAPGGRSGGVRIRSADPGAAETVATKLLAAASSAGDGTDPTAIDPTATDPGSTDPAPMDPTGGLADQAMVTRTADGHGLVLASDADAARGLADPKQQLRDRPGFTAVLPDADTAGLAAWIDIAGLLKLAPPDTVSAQQRANLAPLDQLGYSATNDGDHAFRLKLTFK